MNITQVILQHFQNYLLLSVGKTAHTGTNGAPVSQWGCELVAVVREASLFDKTLNPEQHRLRRATGSVIDQAREVCI